MSTGTNLSAMDMLDEEARRFCRANEEIRIGVGWDVHAMALGWLLARGYRNDVFGDVHAAFMRFVKVHAR